MNEPMAPISSGLYGPNGSSCETPENPNFRERVKW